MYLSLDDGEDLLGHGDGVVDVLVVVGQAHEARLVRVRVSGQWSVVRVRVWVRVRVRGKVRSA